MTNRGGRGTYVNPLSPVQDDPSLHTTQGPDNEDEAGIQAMENLLARAHEIWGLAEEGKAESQVNSPYSDDQVQQPVYLSQDKEVGGPTMANVSRGQEGGADDLTLDRPETAEERHPLPSTSQNNDNAPLLHPRATRHFTLKEKRRQCFQNNVVEENIYDVKWDDTLKGSKVIEVRDEIEALFDHVLHRAGQSHAEQDLARIYINHPSLHKPSIVPPMPLEELNAQSIMDQIDNVLQSDETLPLDEQFQIHLGIAHIPSGVGRKAVKISRVQGAKNDLWAKQSLITINNTAKLCLAWSIVVAHAKLEKHPKYNQIINSRKKIQTDLAKELHRKANVPMDRAATLNDVPKFEKVLQVQVVILSAIRNNKPIYVGSEGRKQVIYLYMTEPSETKREQGNHVGHFDAVVNPKGLVAAQNWCSLCHKPFQSKKKTSMQSILSHMSETSV